MNFQQAKARAAALRKTLKYHSDLYYNHDNPEISDYEYDMLNNELKAIEAAFPELITADSPTQTVGGKASNLFDKITHAYFYGYLDKGTEGGKSCAIGAIRDTFQLEKLDHYVVVDFDAVIGLVDDLKDPPKIEAELRKLLPPERSSDFCHCLVLHGRAVCDARKPNCEACCVKHLCQHFAGA